MDAPGIKLICDLNHVLFDYEYVFQVDPLQRYSAYEILQHPWITNAETSNGGSGSRTTV